jgi:HD-GYP domain-containing protein (c-di-GMP phosphodiesterase class II)
MMEQSPGHFDPALLDVFRRCANRFDDAYRAVEG